jgi:hypothetical protein
MLPGWAVSSAPAAERVSIRTGLPERVSDQTPTETVEVDELYIFVERKKGWRSS